MDGCINTQLKQLNISFNETKLLCTMPIQTIEKRLGRKVKGLSRKVERGTECDPVA